MNDYVTLRLAESEKVWADHSRLHLPATLIAFFKVRNIRSSSAVVSFLRSTPLALLSAELGFDTILKVRSFAAQVLWALHGIVPSSQLVKREPPKFAYGARPPINRE